MGTNVNMVQPQAAIDVNWKFTSDLEVPPMRSFSEFIADKARFEMPPFRDLPKWNNRITSNLLYYQTNYFAIILVLVVLSSVLHASDTFVGLSAIALLGAAITFSLSMHPSVAQARREHALVTLGALVLASYYFVYTIGSVIVVLFTLAVPLLFVMLHASVRLRNLKAKINHQLERAVAGTNFQHLKLADLRTNQLRKTGYPHRGARGSGNAYFMHLPKIFSVVGGSFASELHKFASKLVHL